MTKRHPRSEVKLASWDDVKPVVTLRVTSTDSSDHLRLGWWRKDLGHGQGLSTQVVVELPTSAGAAVAQLPDLPTEAWPVDRATVWAVAATNARRSFQPRVRTAVTEGWHLTFVVDDHSIAPAISMVERLDSGSAEDRPHLAERPAGETRRWLSLLSAKAMVLLRKGPGTSTGTSACTARALAAELASVTECPFPTNLFPLAGRFDGE